MYGRSSACLLFISLLALGQVMESQSDRAFSPNEVAPDLHVRLSKPGELPKPPVTHYTRYPVGTPGSLRLQEFAARPELFSPEPSPTSNVMAALARSRSRRLRLASMSRRRSAAPLPAKTSPSPNGLERGRRVSGIASASGYFFFFIQKASSASRVASVARSAVSQSISGARLALCTTSFSFPCRSRPRWEVARSSQRLRLGGATGQ